MPLEENASWFVFTEGQQHGPVAAEQLIAFLQAHSGPPVYVWRDGFADWMLASDVPELAVPPQLPAPPPPAPSAPSVDMEAPPEPVAPATAGISRKVIGSVVGATIGLLISVPRFLIGADERLSEPAFLAGYVLGGVLLCCLIGFIAGTIMDKSRAARQAEPADSAPPSGSRNIVARHWRGDLPLWASYWLIVWLGNIVFATLGIFVARAFRPESGYNPLNIFAIIALTWSSVVVIVSWQLVGVWRS